MSIPIESLEVLIMEDNKADAEVIRYLLEETGVHNVRFVTNGEEALSLLRKEGPYSSVPRPDLIMLDMQMPRMNGKEFLEKADELIQGIYIVVISGYEKEAIGDMPHRTMIKPGTGEEIDRAAVIIKEIVGELINRHTVATLG